MRVDCAGPDQKCVAALKSDRFLAFVLYDHGSFHDVEYDLRRVIMPSNTRPWLVSRAGYDRFFQALRVRRSAQEFPACCPLARTFVEVPCSPVSPVRGHRQPRAISIVSNPSDARANTAAILVRIAPIHGSVEYQHCKLQCEPQPQHRDSTKTVYPRVRDRSRMENTHSAGVRQSLVASGETSKSKFKLGVIVI